MAEVSDAEAIRAESLFCTDKKGANGSSGDFKLCPKSTIEQLIQDIEKYGLSQEIILCLEDPFVQLQITGTASSETLLEKYVEESIGFTILLDAVLGKYKSLNDLSEKRLISYPIVYNNFKLLNQYLSPYEIKIDKKFRLIGESEKMFACF